MMRMAALMMFLAIALAVSAQDASTTTVAGFITDTWCGRKGANAQHADHARRTVGSGVAQYALYDRATKRLYILEPQATAAQYAGQRVKITGRLGATPLTRAGQSYAPDAVAAYKDPSAPNGLRASAATQPTTSTTSATSTAAISTQPHVQSHENALDQTTRIAGTLAISSIVAEPMQSPARRTSRKR